MSEQEQQQFIQKADAEDDGGAGQQAEWEQSKHQVEQQHSEQCTIAG